MADHHTKRATTHPKTRARRQRAAARRLRDRDFWDAGNHPTFDPKDKDAEVDAAAKAAKARQDLANLERKGIVA